MNKDPIEEDGGENLYGMVYNNPVSFVDYLGFLEMDSSSAGEPRRKWNPKPGDTIRDIASKVRLESSESSKWLYCETTKKWVSFDSEKRSECGNIGELVETPSRN